MNPGHEFLAAIRAAGLNPPEEIHADGELHRFASNGKRNDDAGWYVFHGDGIPAGGFGDWRTGVSYTWRAEIGRKLSPAEAAEVRQRAAETEAKRKANETFRQSKARKRAAAIWQDSEAARTSHPYLSFKGIQSHGIRQSGDDLLIPMRDASGELHSLQSISLDGEKQFLPGSRVKGCYFSIGKPEGALCIAEGLATGASIHEATGYAVAVAFYADNLKPVAVALHAKFPSLRLIVCADDDRHTDGNPGITKATEAARAVGGLIAVPDFGDSRPEKATDFNDIHQHRGANAVKQAVDNAKPADIPEGQPPAADATAPVLDADQATIEQLATLSPIAYDRCRVAEAKRLGVRPSTLDRAVSRARGDSEPVEGGDSTSIFREPNPWSQPVDGAQLLSAVSDMVRRFVILPQHADTAVALWIALTYCIEWAQVAPILAVTSPEKRCGKSTLLFVVDRLSSRPLSSSNISAPALFRAVEKWQPTLIIDEADSFIRDSEEMRGVLNSGHTRPTAYVIRTVGEDFEPRRFSTWGAKAIALIGSLPDTLQDRSIGIDLRRKLSDESAEKVRHVDDEEFSELTSKLERWAADHGSKIAHTRMPTVARLNDRASDNWEPLVAIAKLAGGDWFERAIRAAVALSGDDRESPSTNQELLQDIANVFAEAGGDRIATADLILALCRDEDRPWATYNRGKAIGARQVANRLSEFGIVPGTIRLPTSTPKGYYLEAFRDAFARYLGKTGVLSATTPQPSADAGCGGIDIRHNLSATSSSATLEAAPDKGCGGVADRKPNSGEGSVNGDDVEVFEV